MNRNDTSMGAGQSQFPSTVWDALTKMRSPQADADAVNELAGRYWRPVYRFVRTFWKKSVEDAKDLTQEFFATIFTQDYLAHADPNRGNFRQFLLASLRHFLANDYRNAQRQKRGGNAVHISFEGANLHEQIDDANETDPQKAFDRAWASEILDRAMKLLEKAYADQGKADRFAVFMWYCMEAGGENATYDETAAKFKMTKPQITHAISDARADLRRTCAQLIAQTLDDPSRVEQEMVLLFGRTL